MYVCMHCVKIHAVRILASGRLNWLHNYDARSLIIGSLLQPCLSVLIDNSHMRCTSPTFYPRDAMLARVFARATCPSVRLSHACIVSKRRKLASWFLHHLVAPRFYFPDAKFHHKIRKGSPRAMASNQGGVSKTRIFLALSDNISKKVHDTSKVTISH